MLNFLFLKPRNEFHKTVNPYEHEIQLPQF
jgi:hypothetical protein